LSNQNKREKHETWVLPKAESMEQAESVELLLSKRIAFTQQKNSFYLIKEHLLPNKRTTIPNT